MSLVESLKHRKEKFSWEGDKPESEKLMQTWSLMKAFLFEPA